MAIDKKAVEKAGKKKLHKPSKGESKNRLKTLSQNSTTSHLRNTERIFKYGAVGFKRNIWLSIAATLVMTVTLIILTITVFASIVLSSTADVMKEKIDITIYFQPGTSDAALSTLTEIISSDENVREATPSSSEQEYQKFLSENNSDRDITSVLEDEDMSSQMLSSMQATLRVKVYDTNNLDSIRRLVSENQIFQRYIDPNIEPTYDVNQTEIATINSWAAVAQNGGLILGAVFLGISILVIFNTIRMAIYSRREEIYMMQLVGAHPGFIRGPFLVEAEISGIISGLLASTFVLFGFRALKPSLMEYGIEVGKVTSLMESDKLVLVYLAIIAIGMIIGFISAQLAVNKYIKHAS